LKEGQPIAFLDDAVLIVFNTAIHCEMTNKSENRTLLEQMLASVYGHALHAVAIQHYEWKKAQDQQPAETENFRLEAPPNPESQKPEWVEEAFQHFGESLVDIKKDE
jgi:DNA polymerase-3 subunit gamma/tau